MPLSFMYCIPYCNPFLAKGSLRVASWGFDDPHSERAHNLRQSERAAYVALTDSDY